MTPDTIAAANVEISSEPISSASRSRDALTTSAGEDFSYHGGQRGGFAVDSPSGSAMTGLAVCGDGESGVMMTVGFSDHPSARFFFSDKNINLVTTKAIRMIGNNGRFTPFALWEPAMNQAISATRTIIRR